MNYKIDNEFIRSIYKSSDLNTSKVWTSNICPNRIKGIGYALEGLYKLAVNQDEKPDQINKGQYQPSMIQVISCRLYNLGCSSLLLLNSGYYDESRNILRSMGEITNLLCFFDKYPSEFKRWCNSSKKERMNNFSPATIRKKLIKKGEEIPAAYEWYSSLCEEVTHLTPLTFPNKREVNGKLTAIAGAQYDQETYMLVSHELWYHLLFSITYLSSFTGTNDQLIKFLENVETEVELYKPNEKS